MTSTNEEEIIESQEHKDFEKLCNLMKLEFNDDVFHNIHLDSGQLFAFYSEAIQEATKGSEKEIKGLQLEEGDGEMTKGVGK